VASTIDGGHAGFSQSLPLNANSSFSHGIFFTDPDYFNTFRDCQYAVQNFTNYCASIINPTYLGTQCTLESQFSLLNQILDKGISAGGLVKGKSPIAALKWSNDSIDGKNGAFIIIKL
jgi:hypothetical protein